MSNFPPFSGDDPRCPKCGNLGAYTTWRSHGSYLGGGLIQGYDPNERLCRACSRCDYHWDEAVVPAAGEPTP